ncbi:MAG: hypothetical protein WC372_08920 [Candidatus Neomarinimicrobiota bacterium]|jgi:hypothetical protein
MTGKDTMKKPLKAGSNKESQWKYAKIFLPLTENKRSVYAKT